MPDLEDRQALWATPLEEQRRRDADDERAAQERRSATQAAPAAEPAPARDPEPLAEPARKSWRPVLVVALFATAFAVATLTLDRSAPVRTQLLPSAWGDIAMTCDTARFDGEGARRLEVFTCRAVAGELPRGTYRSPDVTWDSDIDRRPSRSTSIRIGADGVLHGWARY